MNKFTTYALIGLCAMTPALTRASMMDTVRSYAQKAASWSGITADTAQATIPSWGSLTVLGAGIAIGCKIRDITADRRRLLRYAALFAGGVATGALITRWPDIFWTSVKIVTPITIPVGLGYLACKRAMRGIGID